MKKKTLFLSLMAGVALLGSCTRVALSTSPDGYAVVPEGAIVFDTRVSGTKAVTETTASTLQTQGFNVYGLAVTTPLEGDPTFEEYMDNVTVSNHDGVYYGSTTYYWPAGKTMDFYCANAGKEISSTGGAATLAYTLDANREYDLVAAKSIGASSGTVSLTFAHLLSQLQLKVLGLDENATYTLTSLSVTAPTVGTYAFSRDGSDSWTSLGTDAAYSVYSGAGQAVSTSSAANIGTTMAFFPGTATVRAQWTCKVDDQVIGTYDNTALVTLSKGKVNTVTLKLPNASAEPIRFSMSVNAWTNAEEAEVQMGPSATIAVSAAAEETVTLPQMTLSSGTTLVIDWKDGTTDTYEYGVSRTVLNDGTVTPSHTYSEAINDRASLFVTGSMTITTETPEEVAVVDEDAVEVREPVIDYICFTSEEEGNVLTINRDGVEMGKWYGVNVTIYYSSENDSDISNWTELQLIGDCGNKTIDFVGTKLYLKAKAPNGWCGLIESDPLPNGFSLSKNATVEGNIMALLDWENPTSTSMVDNAFYRLFYGCDKLTDASNLVLSATTLSRSCYHRMFEGCTSLINAPALPATTLASSCYQGMFMGCTSLTSAPTLPATIMARDCYSSMFNGCTSLATAPVLSATTLAESCYSEMFSGCTSLATAPALPATTLARGCYSQMFRGCTSLITAPVLSATTLAQSCYFQMFRDCTSLETPPVISATTFAVQSCAVMFDGCTSLTTTPILRANDISVNICCEYMFNGCSNLSTVYCLATTNSFYDDYDKVYFYEGIGSWLDGVASSGTFYKNPNATCWTVGTNVPSGWTIVDYTE